MGESDGEFVPSQPRVGAFRRARRWIFRSIPLAVWIGGIAGVLVLAEHKQRPLGYPGIATVTRYSVSAPVQGVLETLLVAEQERVKPDQLIGRLDGAELELRAQRVRHNAEGLRAEIGRERELRDESVLRRQTDRDVDLRRFMRDVEDANLLSLPRKETTSQADPAARIR